MSINNPNNKNTLRTASPDISKRLEGAKIARRQATSEVEPKGFNVKGMIAEAAGFLNPDAALEAEKDREEKLRQALQAVHGQAVGIVADIQDNPSDFFAEIENDKAVGQNAIENLDKVSTLSGFFEILDAAFDRDGGDIAKMMFTGKIIDVSDEGIAVTNKSWPAEGNKISNIRDLVNQDNYSLKEEKNKKLIRLLAKPEGKTQILAELKLALKKEFSTL